MTVCICVLSVMVCFFSFCSKKETMETKPADNPFLSDFDTPFQVPPFDKIKNEHYLPAFKEGMKQHKKEIAAVVDNSSPPTFENTIEALERSGALLTKVDSVFSVLRGVMTSDEMQNIAKEITPLLSAMKTISC